jgi:hypothetical protein
MSTTAMIGIGPDPLDDPAGDDQAEPGAGHGCWASVTRRIADNGGVVWCRYARAAYRH